MTTCVGVDGKLLSHIDSLTSTRAPQSHDQRQDGEFGLLIAIINIQALVPDLQHFLIAAVMISSEIYRATAWLIFAKGASANDVNIFALVMLRYYNHELVRTASGFLCHGTHGGVNLSFLDHLGSSYHLSTVHLSSILLSPFRTHALEVMSY